MSDQRFSHFNSERTITFWKLRWKYYGVVELHRCMWKNKYKNQNHYSKSDSAGAIQFGFTDNRCLWRSNNQFLSLY